MLIHFAVAAFSTMHYLQRECPVCGHVQLAPPSRMHELLACERCDYHIPPPRQAA